MLKPAARQIFARRPDPLSVSTSYVIMRNGIGALGMAFPVVLIIGGGLDHVQTSLSAYYHFSPAHPAEYGAGAMRDVFVGMLFAIGAFLLFYRGHSFQEDMALNVAGICAVLVALVPMDWPAEPGAVTIAAYIHSTSATLFFVMTAYVCIFRARDTLLVLKNHARRRVFNRIYLVLGILMLATPVTVTALDMGAPARNGHSTLLIEVAGVFFFASFWLVKSFEIRSSLRLVFLSRSPSQAGERTVRDRRAGRSSGPLSNGSGLRPYYHPMSITVLIGVGMPIVTERNRVPAEDEFELRAIAENRDLVI
jgi:hypothetical protein